MELNRSDDALKTKIREAFDSVPTEKALQENTLRALSQRSLSRAPFFSFFRSSPVFPAVLCSFFLILGGHWLYFTPTAQISMDINPSIELGVNRFDRVISLRGCNEDGRLLANEVRVRFSNYTEAVSQILETDMVTNLLGNDEIMEISVVGPDGSQSARIYSTLQTCTRGHRNTYCHFSQADEVAEAHEHGLSYGKYRAYLQILEIYPDITPEQVQSMTMKELHELEHHRSNQPDAEPSDSDARPGHGHHHLRRSCQFR